MEGQTNKPIVSTLISTLAQLDTINLGNIRLIQRLLNKTRKSLT